MTKKGQSNEPRNNSIGKKKKVDSGSQTTGIETFITNNCAVIQNVIYITQYKAIVLSGIRFS